MIDTDTDDQNDDDDKTTTDEIKVVVERKKENRNVDVEVIESEEKNQDQDPEHHSQLDEVVVHPLIIPVLRVRNIMQRQKKFWKHTVFQQIHREEQQE
mmetsp:Transcript_6255/g.6167  ORF Transcript_6255/g.6167 Transcript_6255/m.6167 type:complete len:98 (+) Transcript_6255:143-436(+)